MAPEQAKGRAVDRRTDIFAFGCVFYEVLTGRRAFDGDDVTDILGAVLRIEPDWSRLPPEVPANIRRLLRACLAKDPKNRRGTAADVRLDLDDAFSDGVALTAAKPSDTWLGKLRWLAAGALLAGIGAASFLYVRPQPVSPVVRFEVTPPADVKASRQTLMEVSPDGRHVAFVAGGSSGAQQLWIRSLHEVGVRVLSGTEGAGVPFWSPDSRSIGFFANGQLKTIDIAGGRPQTSARSQGRMASARGARPMSFSSRRRARAVFTEWLQLAARPHG